MAAGTESEPWVLKTPTGGSEYTMYRDEGSDPPALVCRVGATTLTYRMRAIEDLHHWLLAKGGWVPLGAADEKKEAPPDSVEEWGRSADNPARRVVRAAQGVQRPVRHVHAASARGAGPGRGHA